MIKKLFIFTSILVLFFFIKTPEVLAEKLAPGVTCNTQNCNECGAELYCQPVSTDPLNKFGSCQSRLKESIICTTINALNPCNQCETGLLCRPWDHNPNLGTCEKPTPEEIFGTIKPPGVLEGFVKNNPTGAGAISQFLSNIVRLIYMIAAIVLIFMLLWGAFEWLISGGDKEKVAAAQKRIFGAVIGIIIFAVAFAVIRILGMFTGFTFFV